MGDSSSISTWIWWVCAKFNPLVCSGSVTIIISFIAKKDKLGYSAVHLAVMCDGPDVHFERTVQVLNSLRCIHAHSSFCSPVYTVPKFGLGFRPPNGVMYMLLISFVNFKSLGITDRLRDTWTKWKNSGISTHCLYNQSPKRRLVCTWQLREWNLKEPWSC